MNWVLFDFKAEEIIFSLNDQHVIYFNFDLQQVCNAVVVARLLNSTLVIPKFMYSSVWRDMR